MLEELPPIESFEEDLDWMDKDEREEGTFEIEVIDGVYVVYGPMMDRLMSNVNLDDYESLQYFQRTLRTWGIIDALREKGIDHGDAVNIDGFEFDFIE